jgi:hypothetical protein
MLIKRRAPHAVAGQPVGEFRSVRPLGMRIRVGRWAIPWPAAAGAVLVLVVLAVLAIPATATLLTLQSAGDDLRAGAIRLEGKGLELTAGDTKAADAEFLLAERRFQQAEAGLRNDAGFRLLSVLPPGKRQVDAAIVLSRSAVHVARAGHEGVAIANALIAQKVLGPGSHGNLGETALSFLQALTPRLDPIIAELSAAQAERDRLPSGWLAGPIQAAVSSFDSHFGGVVAGLQDLKVIEPGLRSVLGATGPQLYLILQQDSAEIRPSGGFIGSIGFIGFDHGKMRPYESHPVESLDINAQGKPVLGTAGNPRYVEPPDPFKLLINADSWELRDANWSPDFPTTAKLAQGFFTREQHDHLKASGVISIDPNLVASLLTVTGPIYIPETKKTITADNFFKDTIVDVHYGLGKSILSYAAKAIMDRLSKLGPSGLLHVLAVVQRGCDGRSVQAYFDDPVAEAMVERYHCTGRIVPLTSDGVFVVDSNLGASKDDYWVTRQFNLSLQVRADGSVHHVLHLHYDGSNLVPNRDLTLPYRDWLRVYLPPAAHVVHVDGIGAHGLGPRAVSDLGRTVVQGWMEFGFQHSSDVTITYDLGAAAFADGKHQLDLTWQKQAGRVNDPIQVSLQLPAGWSLSDARVNDARRSGTSIQTDLAVDRRFGFSYRSP